MPATSRRRSGPRPSSSRLRAKGIRDTALLRAMELVPREVFAPRRFTDLARTDVALPLPCGQTMTGPAHGGRHARSRSALQPGQRVLEVGTGSGYVTALLAKLGAEVISVERFDTLAAAAAQHLKIVEAGKVRLEVGDGLAARVRDASTASCSTARVRNPGDADLASRAGRAARRCADRRGHAAPRAGRARRRAS